LDVKVRELVDAGVEAYSEGFKKAARQASFFKPSLDSSKFSMDKDVVNGELVDK